MPTRKPTPETAEPYAGNAILTTYHVGFTAADVALRIIPVVFKPWQGEKPDGDVNGVPAFKRTCELTDAAFLVRPGETLYRIVGADEHLDGYLSVSLVAQGAEAIRERLLFMATAQRRDARFSLEKAVLFEGAASVPVVFELPEVAG